MAIMKYNTSNQYTMRFWTCVPYWQRVLKMRWGPIVASIRRVENLSAVGPERENTSPDPSARDDASGHRKQVQEQYKLSTTKRKSKQKWKTKGWKPLLRSIL